jgi:hypothetical protein
VRRMAYSTAFSLHMKSIVRGVTRLSRGGGPEWHPILRTMLIAVSASLYACDGDHSSDCDVIAQALYNGSDEPGEVKLSSLERKAIVAIEDRSGALRCTGTVVEDGLILTAARCLEGGHVAARFESGEVLPLDVVVTEYEGIVLLDPIVRALPAEPLGLWAGGITKKWVGNTAMLAGFGVTETQGLGSLRFVNEPITAVSDTKIEVDGMGSSGACAGDLGGPLLVGAATDGSPKVAGVLVQVSASCTGVDVYEPADRITHQLEVVHGDVADAGPFTGGC